MRAASGGDTNQAAGSRSGALTAFRCTIGTRVAVKSPRVRSGETKGVVSLCAWVDGQPYGGGAGRLEPDEPDELEARGARVGHPKVGDERDKSASSDRRAPGADGLRLGFQGRDLQGPAGRRARDILRARVAAGHAGPSVVSRVPAEEPVIKIVSLRNSSGRLVGWIGGHGAGC